MVQNYEISLSISVAILLFSQVFSNQKFSVLFIFKNTTPQIFIERTLK